MQRDYLEAYTCVTVGREQRALEIAALYAGIQHPTWHAMFAAVVAHINEARGEDDGEGDVQEGAAGRAASMSAAAKEEPLLDLAVEGPQVVLEYDNLPSCTVNYYRMDLELLFSTNPFMEGGASGQAQFSFIRPNRSDEIALPDTDSTAYLAIPDEFASANVVIEAVGGEKRSSAPYYSHTMRCEVQQSVGQIKVAALDTGVPLQCVYIKVFCKSPQGAAFYKDGYTDRRGKFDYVSLSTDQLDSAQRFAILVLSDSNGAVVKHADPPPR